MRRSIPIHHRQPQGSSLIEILIVISILAALVALSLTVLGTAGEAARIAATRATITQVDALLRHSVRIDKAVIRVRNLDIAHNCAFRSI